MNNQNSLQKVTLSLVLPLTLLLGSKLALAAPGVTLVIHTPVDINGNITVISGDKIKVTYNVLDTESGNYRKGDKIQLVRESDDKVVDSVTRDKKNTGTITLKVKISGARDLYVRYIRKGSGDEAVRTGHSDGPGFPLVSIPTPKLDQVALEHNEQTIDQQNLWDELTDVEVDVNERLDAQMRGFVFISGGHFLPTGATTAAEWNRSVGDQNYGFPTNAGIKDLSAPVHMPDGVSVDLVQCYYQDSDANRDLEKFSFALQRSSITIPFEEKIASASFSNSGISIPSKMLLEPPNIKNAEVNNFFFHYYLRARFGASAGHSATTSSDLRFYGCQIGYSKTPE